MAGNPPESRTEGRSILDGPSGGIVTRSGPISPVRDDGAYARMGDEGAREYAQRYGHLERFGGRGNAVDAVRSQNAPGKHPLAYERYAKVWTKHPDIEGAWQEMHTFTHMTEHSQKNPNTGEMEHGVMGHYGTGGGGKFFPTNAVHDINFPIGQAHESARADLERRGAASRFDPTNPDRRRQRL